MARGWTQPHIWSTIQPLRTPHPDGLHGAYRARVPPGNRQLAFSPCHQQSTYYRPRNTKMPPPLPRIRHGRGIIIVDRSACAPDSSALSGFPQMQLHSLPSHDLLSTAADSATTLATPLLGALGRATKHLALQTYLANRDESRATAPPSLWKRSSAHFASTAWSLSMCGLGQRGKKSRHLWDLRWHGENQPVERWGHLWTGLLKSRVCDVAERRGLLLVLSLITALPIYACMHAKE